LSETLTKLKKIAKGEKGAVLEVIKDFKKGSLFNVK
jgi:hypothetical protein